MMFSEKIRQLREEKQLLQRQVSAFLEIDNALYCKLERGDRIAKREQVIELAELFHADPNELLTLWLADQITTVVVGEKEIADKALEIAKQNIKK